MDLLEIESTCAELHEAREGMKALKQQSKALRDKLIQALEERQKHILSVGKFSIELKERVSVNIDKKRVLGIIEQGGLPQDIITGSSITHQLLLVEGSDIRLEGNRFTKNEDK